MVSIYWKDFHRVELEIPFPHKCPELINYEKRIRKIQEETETRIRLFQIVRIEGDEKKVEEAWRRVSGLEISELDGDGKEENHKELQKLLNDIKKKMADVQCEKKQMEETIKNFKTEVQEVIHGMSSQFKQNLKKLEEEIHAMSNKCKENSIKGSEDDSTDDYVNLDAFYKSQGYIQRTVYGRQPLHIACELGRLDVVKKLIINGAKINAKDDDGWTPLHFSAWKGHLDLVKYLISKNACVNEQDDYGRTALIDAVWNGHVQVVKYLCLNKANIHIKNKLNLTALDIPRHRNKTEILEILHKYL